ncbi:MAG: hypothetical protein PF542_03295 [Nanoarchaeota archaeon]|jgi:hypothetical protein|nr:hypothetical protein [Nanoarchaeota archaeon]
MVKRELRDLKTVAKLIVPRETRRNIRRIKGDLERMDLYKHSIKSNLEMRIHNIEKEMNKQGKKHDVFHLMAKAKLVNLKIKYFYITHDKKDLKELLKILKDVEGELKSLGKEK